MANKGDSPATLQRLAKEEAASILDSHSIPLTPGSKDGRDFERPQPGPVHLELGEQRSSQQSGERPEPALEDAPATIDNGTLKAAASTRKHVIDKIEIETTNIFTPGGQFGQPAEGARQAYLIQGDLYRRTDEAKRHFRRSSNVPISRMEMVFDEGKDDLDSRSKAFHSGNKTLKGGRGHMRQRISLIPKTMDSFKLTQDDINASTEMENRTSSYMHSAIHGQSPVEISSTNQER